MERGIIEPVRRAIDDVVSSHPGSARSREVAEGDHILIMHDDAGLLARTARRILDDVHDAPGRLLLRIALQRSDVRLQESANSAVLPGVQAIAVAARIEPRVTPGRDLVQRDVSRRAAAHAVPLSHGPARRAPGAGGDGEYEGCFNVRKEGRTTRTSGCVCTAWSSDRVRRPIAYLERVAWAATPSGARRRSGRTPHPVRSTSNPRSLLVRPACDRTGRDDGGEDPPPVLRGKW